MSDSAYDIVDGVGKMNLEWVQQVLADTYWAPGVSIAEVRKAAEHSSLVVGAFYRGRQVAYLRVVSDFSTFGWISDVIVSPEHQGKGLARAMVRHALRHPEHQGFRRWVLKTRDAHGVYEECGFRMLPDPEEWMVHDPREGDGPR